MLKFADRRVVGWKDRYLNHAHVMNRLIARMRNGFSLTCDERKFYEDTNCLWVRYNPGKRCPW